MQHDLISVVSLGGLIYLIFALNGKAKNVKCYIRVNNFFKYVLGFFAFKGNEFSLKGIVSQIGNLIAISIGILAILFQYKDTIGLFITLELFNIFIVFIISLFVNK